MWLVAVKIVIPGITDPIRVVRNNENVTWQGETWQAFPFDLDEVGEDSKGEVPRVELKISNVSRAIERHLRFYDTYVKTNGFAPVEVTIYVINSKNLSNTVPEVEYLFELKQPKTNAMWATFVLGAANPFNNRYPKNRILKDHCRFRFKSLQCGYTGGETACDKTLTRCMELVNSNRFGGFPGVGGGGTTIVFP